MPRAKEKPKKTQSASNKKPKLSDAEWIYDRTRYRVYNPDYDRHWTFRRFDEFYSHVMNHHETKPSKYASARNFHRALRLTPNDTDKIPWCGALVRFRKPQVYRCGPGRRQEEAFLVYAKIHALKLLARWGHLAAGEIPNIKHAIDAASSFDQRFRVHIRKAARDALRKVQASVKAKQKEEAAQRKQLKAKNNPATKRRVKHRTTVRKPRTGRKA